MGKIFPLKMNALYKGKSDKIDMAKWIDAIVQDTDVAVDTAFEGKIIADGYFETKLALATFPEGVLTSERSA
jgi:hypothetical protein